MNFQRWALIVAIGEVIGTSQAFARTTLSTFDNFTPTGIYGAWAAGPPNVVSSGPTSFNVLANDFGGITVDIPGTNAANDLYIELDLTVMQPPSFMVVSLIDGDGSWYNYLFTSFSIGANLLHQPLSAPWLISFSGNTPGLDKSNLIRFRMDADDGPGPDLYQLSFNNLALTTTVPEVSTFALAASGFISLFAARRSYFRRKVRSYPA